jgi:hypothetical protein
MVQELISMAMMTPGIPIMDFDEWVSETLGTVPAGVADVSTVTELTTAGTCEDPSALCPICHETLNNPLAGGESAPVRRINRCNHTYCSTCIERWLTTSKKCPMCMEYVDIAGGSASSSSAQSQRT